MNRAGGRNSGGPSKTEPSIKNIVVRTANGGEMCQYGDKEVTFSCGEGGEMIGLQFQVTDVKKPYWL